MPLVIYISDIRPKKMYGDTLGRVMTFSSWYVVNLRPAAKTPHRSPLLIRSIQSNGEKASPGPIETIVRSSPQLSDAIVVGSDKPQLGLLLFSRVYPPPPDLLDLISPLIQEANQSSPSYAQISVEMCSIVDKPDRVAALPKSSKGTVQRGLAYEVFRDEIDKLYEGGSADHTASKRSQEQIETYLEDLINRVVGEKVSKRTRLERGTDLFSWGVDSIKAAQIRLMMLKVRKRSTLPWSPDVLQADENFYPHQELNTGGNTLPRNIVFEQPSIEK